MDAEKYDRSVALLCSTCGGDQFEFRGGSRTVESALCVGCGREFGKDELIEENSENINEHITEMGRELVRDFAKEMRDTLKRTLRGSKHIKLK